MLNWTDPHVEDYHWWWKLNLTLWPLRPNNTLDFVESSSSESTSCEECEQEHGYRCFVCVSFSCFYFEIVRVVHRRWTQCQTARLDLCTNVLQGKGIFSTCENAGKKCFGPTTTIFAYLLSFFFFSFLPNLSLGEFVRSWHSGDSAWIPNKHKVVRTVSAGWLEAVYALYDCTRRQPWRV